MKKYELVKAECYEIIEKYDQIALKTLKEKLNELLKLVNYVENYDYIIASTKNKLYLTLINDDSYETIIEIFNTCLSKNEVKILELEWE